MNLITDWLFTSYGKDMNIILTVTKRIRAVKYFLQLKKDDFRQTNSIMEKEKEIKVGDAVVLKNDVLCPVMIVAEKNEIGRFTCYYFNARIIDKGIPEYSVEKVVLPTVCLKLHKSED